MATRSQELAEELRERFSGRLNGDDLSFLRDIQGFVEFAITNGLSMPMIITTLAQDLNELMRDGFDLQKATSRGFKPKVRGYSSLTDESFGSSEEAALEE